MTKPTTPKEKKKVNAMIPTLVIMSLFTVTLTVLAYLKDPNLPVAGLQDGGKMLLGIIPVLILAFIAAGMIGKVLPRELLTQWLGNESGFRGLAIATVAGSITPGGPFIQFPIVAALLQSGAGVAPIAAYITAWSLFGINRLIVFEIPLLGWKLVAARVLASLIFPFVIGLMTRFFYTRL
jgi:uncharacterized membrane protein YraQ (UPF0718 family)